MKRIKLFNNVQLPLNGILKKDFVRAINNAEAVTEATNTWLREETEKLREYAMKQRDEAISQGYRTGFSAFLQATNDYEEARRHIIGKVEELLKACLVHVLNRLPPEEVVEASISSALGSIAQDDEVIIKVHAKHERIFKEALPTFIEASGTSAQIRIVGDSNLPAGECAIYTSSEVINASISVIVEQMITALSHEMNADLNVEVSSDGHNVH